MGGAKEHITLLVAFGTHAPPDEEEIKGDKVKIGIVKNGLGMLLMPVL